MASMVAPRILNWSISATLALAIHQASARSRTSKASSSRRAAVNFLESLSPTIGASSSRMTAAANTGPARGPRPASSTPARNIAGIVISANRLICTTACLLDDRFRNQTRRIQRQAEMDFGETTLDFFCVACISEGAPGSLSQGFGCSLVLKQFRHDKVSCQYIRQAYPRYIRPQLTRFP